MPRWPGAVGCGNVAAAAGIPVTLSGWSVGGSSGAGKEEQQELKEANWAWLADPDNADKLRKVTTAWKAEVERCAARLLALEGEAAGKLQNLSSFQETLHASQAPGFGAEEPAPRFAKYGSKIEALVKHVQRLQSEDDECKIICFVQWEDLKRKISSALEEFELNHLTLQGSVWARRAALMKFQYEADSPRMLLLSLEESASGTNLTSSNHVIIVHPMEAATREEAVAFEMQAVGRVRRPGQQRKIHIWRFVTVGTIEQQITEEHQRELWERQQAKILVSQPDPRWLCAESDEDADDTAAAIPDAVADPATQCYISTSVPVAPQGDPATQCYISAGGTDGGNWSKSGSGVKPLALTPEPAAGASGGGRVNDEMETLPWGAAPGAAEDVWPATQCYADPQGTQCY